jgi:hypothetical protein
MFHFVVVGQLVMGKDKEWACLKEAIEAAQAHCANFAPVNRVGVCEAKVPWPLCRCNDTAFVFRVDDSIQQELSKPVLMCCCMLAVGEGRSDAGAGFGAGSRGIAML